MLYRKPKFHVLTYEKKAIESEGPDEFLSPVNFRAELPLPALLDVGQVVVLEAAGGGRQCQAQAQGREEEGPASDTGVHGEIEIEIEQESSANSASRRRR